MKHYVLNHDLTKCTEPGVETPVRQHHIDLILSGNEDRASAELVIDFYQALNDFLESQTYVVNLRVAAAEPVGGPLYWLGRTAIIWGHIRKTGFAKGQGAWVSQVLNLSSRSILVGDAVLFLAQAATEHEVVAAIHPNVSAAASEAGLIMADTDILMADDGRLHSAASRLSALRLLLDFASLDHGAYLAETLRGYIGLTEPRENFKSVIATRLHQRSAADPLVGLAIQTMLEQVEEPMSISDLSKALGTSTRQIQRRFLKKTGETLLATYRELRLERAHCLLAHTDMPPREIATATGFSSVTSMSKAFRACYHCTPEDVRGQRYRGNLTVQTA